MTCIKLSILLFYRRIFATKRFRQWTNVVGILVVIWFIAHNFSFAFQCSPVRKAWDFDIPGRCINPLNNLIGFHSANVALDIVILALPISAVWRLQMSMAKKVSVAGIFFLGGLYDEIP